MTGPVKILIWTQLLITVILGKYNVSRFNIRTKQGWETRIKLADPIHDALVRVGISRVPATTVRSAITFDNFLMSNFSTDFLEYLYSQEHTSKTNPIQTLRYYLGYAPDNSQTWKAAKNVYQFLQTKKNKLKISSESESSSEEDLSIQDEISMISKLEKSLRKRKKLLTKSPGIENESFEDTEESFLNTDHVFNKTLSFKSSSEEQSGESEEIDETDSNSDEKWKKFTDISKLLNMPTAYSVQSHPVKAPCEHNQNKEDGQSHLNINEFLIQHLLKIVRQITQLRKIGLANVDTKPSLMKYINRLYYSSTHTNNNIPETDIKKVASNLVRYVETLINAMPEEDHTLDKSLKNRLRKAIENSLLGLFEDVPQKNNKQKTANPKLGKKGTAHLFERQNKRGHRYMPLQTRNLLVENEENKIKTDINPEMHSSERYADFRTGLNKETNELKPTENKHQYKVDDEVAKRTLPLMNDTQNPTGKNNEELHETKPNNIETHEALKYMTRKLNPGLAKFESSNEKKTETIIPINSIVTAPFDANELKTDKERSDKNTEILLKTGSKNHTDAVERTSKYTNENITVEQKLSTDAEMKQPNLEASVTSSPTSPLGTSTPEETTFIMDLAEPLFRNIYPPHGHHNYVHQGPIGHHWGRKTHKHHKKHHRY